MAMDKSIQEVWNKLDAKQQMAIEFRYLGYTYPQIAERLQEVPLGTIQGWFKTGGVLEAVYSEYTKSMSEERMAAMQKSLIVLDEEWLTHSTNAVRVWAKWNTQPRKVPLINKKGEAVFDKNGDIVMVDYIPQIKFADVIRAFVLQRTLMNRPARFDPRLAAGSESEEVDKAIEALGLTELDFTEDKEVETYERIRQYLNQQ